MSDGAGHEVERMNARAQHLRAQRGELGHDTLPLPDTSLPYELRRGDLICWRAIQRVANGARIENGTRGHIEHIDPHRDQIAVALIGSDRRVTVTGDQLDAIRLGYAQHVVRQQGATVDHAIALTGGWQTARESAYVQASRARHGIDWYVARDDLGTDGSDPDRIQRLADRIAQSRAKTASLDHPLATDAPAPTYVPITEPPPRYEPRPRFDIEV